MAINRDGTGKANLHVENFEYDDLNSLPTRIQVKDKNGYSRWLNISDNSDILTITSNGIYSWKGGTIEVDTEEAVIEPLNITENNQTIYADPGVSYSPITVSIPIEGVKNITANGIYYPADGYAYIGSVNVQIATIDTYINDDGIYYALWVNHTLVYGGFNTWTLNSILHPTYDTSPTAPDVRIPYTTTGAAFRYMSSWGNRISGTMDPTGSYDWGYKVYFKTMTKAAYEAAWTARTDCDNAVSLDMDGVSESDFTTMVTNYPGAFSLKNVDSTILSHWTTDYPAFINPDIGMLRIEIPSLSVTNQFKGMNAIKVIILKLGYISTSASGLCANMENLECVVLEGAPNQYSTYPGGWFNGYNGYIYVDSNNFNAWYDFLGSPLRSKLRSIGQYWYEVGA